MNIPSLLSPPWFSAMYPAMEMQQRAAFRLLAAAKEKGHVRIHLFATPVDEKKERKRESDARRARHYRKKRGTNISYTGNSAENKMQQALRMRKEGKMTSYEIAEKLNIGDRTVRRWFAQNKQK